MSRMIAKAVREIVRTLRPGGRLVLFVPNRGYPFETHGIYWRGKYHFGNIPLVNYLPRRWRNRLAPHVRVYSRGDLERLFAGLPVRMIQQTVIFGAYDNIIARRPALGRVLRAVLQTLEKTPLRVFGLSHFWVVEKTRQITQFADSRAGLSPQVVNAIDHRVVLAAGRANQLRGGIWQRGIPAGRAAEKGVFSR